MSFHEKAGGILAAAALIFFLMVPTWAATLTVTNLNDSGAGSLRQAIPDANPGDMIDFAVTGTIFLTSGELLVQTGPVTIQGPGADQLTIDGNNSSRVFHIAAGTTATITGVTVANGNAGTDLGGDPERGDANASELDRQRQHRGLGCGDLQHWGPDSAKLHGYGKLGQRDLHRLRDGDDRGLHDQR